MDKVPDNKIRYNLFRIFVYILAGILLLQLFNLQVVQGEEYRELSNTRLTREVEIQASRGLLKDRNETVLAGVENGFCLNLYRSKIEISELNYILLQIANILEKNGDEYIDSFPINIKDMTHVFNNEEGFLAWKLEYDLDENLSTEQVIYELKDKYEIEQTNINDVRKIIGLRYEISTTGYSSINPLQIAKNISKNSVLELSERNFELAGVYITQEPIRVYTNDTLASHVLGYIGRVDEYDLNNEQYEYDANDYIGRSGIESVFEEYLRGEDGLKYVDMNVDGGVIEEHLQKEASAGKDITLTIDSNLQRITEQAIEDNIEKIKSGGYTNTYDAKAGMAVVLDIKTGEVLALASYPDFEPQLFVNGISTKNWQEYLENNALFNRAVQGAYAPGSIFKMVSSIAGLQSEVITGEEDMATKGVSPYAHNPQCWYYAETGYNHGVINVSEAIKHSCNYFFYELGYRMGIEELEKYAKYFGLGSKTGIELNGEAQGMLATRENLEKTGEDWNLGNTLSAVIGQGQNNFSPIQIAQYIASLANGGLKVEPTLIKEVTNPDGSIVSKEEVEGFVNDKLGLQETYIEDTEISDANLEYVLEGMRSVTEERDGTAYGAFATLPFDVAGKTGSAEAGEYTNGWFAGFAPYDDPEIAIVAMVENANKGSYTAEIARKIIDEYFGLNVDKEEIDGEGDI